VISVARYAQVALPEKPCTPRSGRPPSKPYIADREGQSVDWTEGRQA